MRVLIGFVIGVLIVVSFQVSRENCNRKGSLAAQINWANRGTCK